VDALRGGEEPVPAAAKEAEPREETTTVKPADRTLVEAREDLDSAGVPAAVLTYADADCRLHSVTLPDLGPHPGPEGRSCLFTWTAGNELSFGEAPPSPVGDLRLRCRQGTVGLVLWNGERYARASGRCGISWKPDGSPTFLHGGELMRFAPCPADEPGTLPTRCAQTVLSRADLAVELRRAGWKRSRFALEEALWLTNARLAAIVRASDDRSGDDLLVVIQGRRLVTRPGFGYEKLAALRPSPLGTHVAARIATGGLAVVDRTGRPVRLAMTHGRAVTWSPDEEWIAQATDDGVYVFRSGDRSPVFVNLPIMARDLVWR
jgi:hypothetical protein